jgi:hypothetical protein
MKLTSFILGLAASATAGTTSRQSGPIEPETDTAYSSSDNCKYFENFWAISHADFVPWVSQSFLDAFSFLISSRIHLLRWGSQEANRTTHLLHRETYNHYFSKAITNPRRPD